MTRTSDRRWWRCWASSFALALAWAPAAWADLWPCACHNDQPCCAPYYHPSFGYYPTQWRAWSVAEPASIMAVPTHSEPITVSVPASYTPPLRVAAERPSTPMVQRTTEPPVTRTAVVLPPDQPTLLNLNAGNARGVDGAALPVRPPVLNLGGVPPNEYLGISYRSLP